MQATHRRPAARHLGRKIRLFSRTAIENIPLPETDRTALWPIYDRYRDGFVSLRADCSPDKPIHVVIEEIIAG